MSTIVYLNGPETVNNYPVLVYLGTEENAGYAICDRGHGTYDRFASWSVYATGRVYADLTPEWEAFAGHYFSDLHAALHDLEERAA
jgi:hypothetical protein